MAKPIACLAFLMALLLFAAGGQALADDHREKGKHRRETIDRAFQGLRTHGKGDHGNETTGQIAIWLLAAANFTVITSVLIKGANRILPLGEERRRWLSKINQLQKKYLSSLHYLLNPVILCG